MKKTVYYSDELNDDFSRVDVKTKDLPVDHNYFSRSLLKRFLDFLLYYFVVVPVCYLYRKIIFGEKVVNRKAFRGYRKNGFFLYGNHTRMAGDAFTPVSIAFPKKSYIIAGPDSVSVPVVGHITESLGCVPLPTTLSGLKTFHKAVFKHSEKNHVMTIYPEAHIWPYYTGIRPFKDTSFRYPIECQKPVFTFTVTYQKRRFSKKPKTTVYIDGPFFAKPDLKIKENQKYLRDLAYNAMKERAKNSTEEYVKYVKIKSESEKENKV